MFRRLIIVSLIICCLMLLCSASPSSGKSYSFETSDFTNDEIKQIWSSVNIRTSDDCCSLEDISAPIVSFDVHENGNILMGLINNRIIILDENQNVLRSIKFFDLGTFYVKWQNDNILLMLVRGSILIEFTVDGNLINVTYADCANEKNNSLWRQEITNREICINNNKYYVSNGIKLFDDFFPFYSQLIKIDENGNKFTIYDVQAENIIIILIVLIFIGIFGVVGIVNTIKYIKTRRNTQCV